MKNKKYRVYNLILTDIENPEDDLKFLKLIQDKKYDWWRRSPLVWIIVTPIEISTNQIIVWTIECYKHNPFYVLEIDIKDFGGIEFLLESESKNIDASTNQFVFFRTLVDEKYIPMWER